ncbi:AAA+-type ATPase, SpoVK/Ycf46/Vps4 family [Marinospirillum celere]|uniref:AAA+-type ATPase, SpoVK/Ycf46/Vps4 family n=1 Tax=Marinospirillum celere TaxID=1122252 RepID=A0A1I1EQT8_9GAMM|nr:ATP-binding protein [Marinospirillum celere]SFB87290.1 AAA+-type ATPase, SpoVK/Ycf46/Vps4 family [Marinospirillum celere]
MTVLLPWSDLLSFTASNSGSNYSASEQQLARVLVARLLLLGEKRQLLGKRIDWPEIFAFLGVVGTTREVRRQGMEAEEKGDYSELTALLQHWLEQQALPGQGFTGGLIAVIELLGERMQLDAGEQKLLMLMWLTRRHPLLVRAADAVEVNNEPQALSFLEELLSLQPSSLSGVATKEHPLKSFNFVNGFSCFQGLDAYLKGSDFLDVFNNTLELDSPTARPLEQQFEAIWDDVCPRFHGDSLPPEDFSYVPQLQVLRDYLADALRQQRPAANILLYGKPGVGKTLLAASLADWLQARLHEVPFAKEGVSLPPDRRIQLLAMGQAFMQNNANTCFLFDEMEDMFQGIQSFGSKGLAKAWMNHYLETNPLPTIWVCNSLEMLDSSYLRRFDLILEVPTPATARYQKKRAAALAPLPVTNAFRDWLAAADWVTPALLSLLKRLGQHLPGRQPLQNQKKLLALLEQRLKAEGQPLPDPWFAEEPVQKSKASQYCLPDYSLDWLNTDLGLESVVQQIGRLGNARLCLHGHPGTGKTAFADYLAKELKQPLVVKSASSLLGKYVGETEKQLEAMFAEAKHKKAVLLLDEAETFLQSRLDASLKGWEVSKVNEMLIQMERFQGVVIATSNRFEQLDAAAMRRFDLKVAFDWLQPQQLQGLLQAVFYKHPKDLQALKELGVNRLARLQVSPGNVQTALRRLNLQGKPLCLKLLLSALEDEASVQHQDKAAPMGFIHS